MLMTKELKLSILLGTFLGLILWLSSNIDQSIGMLFSLAACIIFGPLTVWQIKQKPNIYALVVCLVSGLFLVFSYGLKIGSIYLVGVVWVYGIMSVQLSMALANSYDNIVFMVSKFKGRK